MQGKSYSMDRLSNFTSFAININIFFIFSFKILKYVYAYLFASQQHVHWF